MLRVQVTSTPAPTEPFREVISQYMNTLCTTQKQTYLTNSLLQDIAIFNEHNSANNESQAKLAKAKSRGITHTLVMEAINSEKTWDEIKDLLRLKLCNANIYTYASCFMDIQQQEESLAAYLFQFKTEAK